MKIFFCHSSHNKAIVREIIRFLPSYLDSWIDEKNLLIGADITQSLKDAVQEEADFVVVFFDEKSVESNWVKKELRWALEREKRLRRTFVLPVLIDKVQDKIKPKELRGRRYVEFVSFGEKEVERIAFEISEAITKWIFEEYESIKTKYYDPSREFVRAFKDWEAVTAQTDFSATISSATTFDIIALSANVLKSFQNEFGRLIGRGGKVRIILYDHGCQTKTFYEALSNILRERVKSGEAYEVADIINEWKQRITDGDYVGSVELRWLCGVPLQYNLWVKDFGKESAEGNLSVYFYQGRNYTPVFRGSSLTPKLVEALASEFDFVWFRLATSQPSVESSA